MDTGAWPVVFFSGEVLPTRLPRRSGPSQRYRRHREIIVDAASRDFLLSRRLRDHWELFSAYVAAGQRVRPSTQPNGYTVQVTSAHDRDTSGKQTSPLAATVRWDVLTDRCTAQLDAPNILLRNFTDIWARQLCDTQYHPLLRPFFIPDVTKADRGGLV